MKKLILFFLVVGILSPTLVGCGKRESFSVLSEAVENTSSQKRYNADFLAEYTFGNNDTTLLFAQGNYSVDREKRLLYSEFVQTHLGNPGKFIEMCKDGFIYANLDGQKNKYKKNTDEHLEYIFYSEVLNFKYEDIKNFKESKNSGGTLYSFTVESGYDSQLMTMLGEGIYSTAEINKPQKDKTRFGEIKCEYTVTEDKSGRKILASSQIVFTVYLYDTPPYSPTHTPPEEDYMLELRVRFKVSYKEFGESVEIIEPETKEFKLVE